MNVNLFTGWMYEPKNEIREEEFEFCYQKNKDLSFNKYIIDNTKRPTFNHFLKEMMNYPNDINIIANPDNFFDESFLNGLRDLYTNYNDKEKLCLGLTRWNYVNEDYIWFFNAKDSQDVFVFYGSVDFENYKDIIPFGVPGGDNRLVSVLMYEYNKNVYNPSKDLKYYHYHPSDDLTRTYLDENRQKKEHIDGPHEFLIPCTLNDIK
jgi:hypothetical protein